jgi:hypothetical protein
VTDKKIIEVLEYIAEFNRNLTRGQEWIEKLADEAGVEPTADDDVIDADET